MENFVYLHLLLNGFVFVSRKGAKVHFLVDSYEKDSVGKLAIALYLHFTR
ncbi:hypothetical protein [Anabaena azotica]